MMKIEATSALFLILGLGGGMTNRTPRLSVASPKMSERACADQHLPHYE
jgi:hypothetical protein